MPPESHPSYHLWLTLDQELMRRKVDGWTLAVPPDTDSVLAVAAFAAAFRATHGAVSARVNLVLDKRVADAAEAYAGQITQTLVHPDLSASLLDALGELGRFRPNTPFLADVTRCADGRLGAFFGHRGVDGDDLWRYVLHLPWSAPAQAPDDDDAGREAGRAAFAAARLPPGRTALLCRNPEDFFAAPTGPVWSEAHWSRLAERLAAAGWAVASLNRPGVAPVAGTFPVAAPIRSLNAFVGAAGWAISGCRGLARLLRRALAARTLLYPDVAHLSGLMSAGPSDAPEIDDALIPTDATPEEFAARIVGGRRPAAV